MRNTDRASYRAACAIFLVSFLIGLCRILPWLDWGTQPDFAAAAFNLSTGPASSSPLILIICKLAGQSAAGGSFVFSTNIFAAFLYAAAAAAIFLAGRELSGSVLCGLAAWVVFAGASSWKPVFDVAGQGPFVIIFSVFCMWAAAVAVKKGASPAALPLFCFLFGAAAFQHMFLFAVFAVSIVFIFIQDERARNSAAHTAAAVFLAAAGLTPVAMLALRPRFSLATGSAWASNIIEAANIPASGKFQDIYGNIPDTHLFGDSVFRLFIESPLAPYFPIMAISLVGLAFVPEKKKSYKPLLLLFVLLALLTYAPSPSRSIPLFLLMALTCAALLFAAASAEILAAISESRLSKVKWLAPAAAVFIFAAAAYPLRTAFADAISVRESKSGEYAALFLKSLRRDALVIIDPVDDPLQVVAAAPWLIGARDDIVRLYPDRFEEKPYRDTLRRTAGGRVAIPTEQYYNDLMKQAAENSKSPEGVVEKPEVVKRRVTYNLMMMNQRLMAAENSRIVPVYFNTIQRFIRSKSFNNMCYTPIRLLFRYRENLLDKCIIDTLGVSRKEGKIRGLPPDEKAADEEIKKTTVFLSEAAAACDSMPAGFSLKCLRNKLAQMKIEANPFLIREGQIPAELTAPNAFYPLPEMTQACFEAQYYFSPAYLMYQWKAVRASNIMSDPQAARLLAAYYSDIGEHAYIHKDRIDIPWFFQTSEYINNGNLRAHLFMFMIYENSAMHDMAQKEADTLLSLLSENERAGRLYEEHYYMLQEIYTRIGKPAEAEKYRKLIEGDTGDKLAP